MGQFEFFLAHQTFDLAGQTFDVSREHRICCDALFTIGHTSIMCAKLYIKRST